jgi:hypothetical protein
MLERFEEVVRQNEQLVRENERLRAALIAHRADLHMGSSRPCPTCRESAKVLGIKVPDRCAIADVDTLALAAAARREEG